MDEYVLLMTVFTPWVVCDYVDRIPNIRGQCIAKLLVSLLIFSCDLPRRNKFQAEIRNNGTGPGGEIECAGFIKAKAG